ncbi:MAG: Nicotinate-nucleotide adenylyltransferase [uncultured Solirubrobacterales bacterium]|uniref:Probable nicotinate-nucleotide adenylyltransferase n=1 Tax=uncultured Solirubrobacterales bacterium TaxID=768556 RepID=A0A6J4SUM7_9ACTN|nr:MAG: Nicotinate-nucleotide adenylyltransferase [uncultured Solirubrobacterales bacterium]
MRLGILGGVLNPPHLGHLVVAQEALAQLELDEVWFVPVGRAPHREVEADPGADARLGLCRAATADDERLGVSRIELDRPGPSYTADTLRTLRSQRPATDELVLLLGSDQAAELPQWHQPEEVLALAEVGVVARAGLSPHDVRARLGGLRGAEGLRFFEMPRIDISSTLVRRRVAEGRPIRYLVPRPVERLIAELGLYRAPVTAS